jgi:ribA/ribD-fused uncharacterized protein
LPDRGFAGDFRFLSNFFPSAIEGDRIGYPTVGHAYPAAKGPKRSERERIAALPMPGGAKQLGRKIRPADWDARRLYVIGRPVLHKFGTHTDPRELLLSTSHCYLVETNLGDLYWGVSAGVGENHLGRILMRVREMLQPGAAPA